jgi:hypothetical protein
MLFTSAMVAAYLRSAFWALDALGLVVAASIAARAAVVHW